MMYSSSCSSIDIARQTHTVATLPVPTEVWELVAKALYDAGYAHAFSHDGTMIDMTGIGLVKQENT